MKHEGRFLRVFVLAIAALALLTVSGVPGSAAAADGEAERSSHQHFNKGETYYSASRFSEALTEYQAGYEAVPLPGFLVNIAQCYRRLGDLKRARVSYQKFVLVSPDSPLIPEVRSLIAEVDRLISESEGTEPPTEITQPAGHRESQGPGSGDDVLGPGSSAVVSLAAPNLAPPPQSPVTTNLLVGGVASAPVSRTWPSAQPTTGRHRWWLWGTIGAAVIGGSVVAVLVANHPGAPAIHEGTLGTLRR